MTAHIVILGASIRCNAPTPQHLVLYGMNVDVSPACVVSDFVEVGRALVVVGKETNDILDIAAIYVLDANAEPYQIAGLSDALLRARSITDHTAPYLPRLRCAQEIVKRAYKALTIQQLIDHETDLYLWEEKLIKSVLAQSLEWRAMKRLASQLLRITRLPHSMQLRLRATIRDVKRPAMSKISAPISLKTPHHINRIGLVCNGPPDVGNFIS